MSCYALRWVCLSLGLFSLSLIGCSDDEAGANAPVVILDPGAGGEAGSGGMAGSGGESGMGGTAGVGGCQSCYRRTPKAWGLGDPESTRL